MKNKISQLFSSSKDVISQCCLDNGAIIAANSFHPSYPHQAKNYFYVWPRDASFTCMAASILKLFALQENFFTWLMERADGWKETGLFYEKYYPNGAQALERFQPDQTGSVLTSIATFLKYKPKIKAKFQNLITHSANGLCRIWNEDHFASITNDLWEERLAFPDMKENFMYSLAACIKGLLSAYDLYPDPIYLSTADKMKNVFLSHAARKGFFFRSFGTLNDERLDASTLGIIWPFEIVDINNPLAIKTVALIEKKLVKNYGLYRYQNDEYDGWVFRTMPRNKGAGYWPILNFWMAIVLKKMGQEEAAMQYYSKVIKSVKFFIPEQIFHNKYQQSVSPLCWSHAMFIIASYELGLLPNTSFSS